MREEREDNQIYGVGLKSECGISGYGRG